MRIGVVVAGYKTDHRAAAAAADLSTRFRLYGYYIVHLTRWCLLSV